MLLSVPFTKLPSMPKSVRKGLLASKILMFALSIMETVKRTSKGKAVKSQRAFVILPDESCSCGFKLFKKISPYYHEMSKNSVIPYLHFHFHARLFFCHGIGHYPSTMNSKPPNELLNLFRFCTFSFRPLLSNYGVYLD